MSRFSGLNAKLDARSAPPSPSDDIEASDRKAGRAKARDGKKALIGYYSPQLSKELQLLAIAEDKTMQALLGEAIDLLMRDRGKATFGER